MCDRTRPRWWKLILSKSGTPHSLLNHLSIFSLCCVKNAETDRSAKLYFVGQHIGREILVHAFCRPGTTGDRVQTNRAGLQRSASSHREDTPPLKMGMVSDRLPPASSGRMRPAQTSQAAEDSSHSPAYQTGDSHAAGTPSPYVIKPNSGAPSTSKAGSTAVDLLGQSYEAASRSGQSSSQDRGVIELDQEPACGGQGRTLSFWFSSTSFPGVGQASMLCHPSWIS